MAGKQRCFTWINIGLPDTNLGQNERMTGMGQDDDTVYCDIQMPLAQGRELLELVIALRASNAHPCLDKVFECGGQLTPDTTLSFSSARAGANPSLNW